MSFRVEREDLELIAEKLSESFSDLKSSSIFLTGGTGFFGKWLLEAILFLNGEHGLTIEVTLLSRNPDRFLKDNPQFDVPCFKFIKGDIESFEIASESYDYLIHAATDADSAAYRDRPEFVFNSIVNGTKHVIEQAKVSKIKRLLYLSSGAVYGPQPKEMEKISENYQGAPDLTHPASSYGEGKRVSEFLLNCFATNSSTIVTHARCFAFAGPYIPFNRNLAAGDFVRDLVTKNRIEIGGDGTPLRSYLYTADLVVWLFTILLRGENKTAYNVGSDEAISIKELAEKLCSLRDGAIYTVAREADLSVLPARYIPDISFTSEELNLDVFTSFSSTLKKLFFYSTYVLG